MREPCRSCPERGRDLGGCRCQAYLLAGDASATDPACDKAPRHDVVLEAIGAAAAPAPLPLRFRSAENSQALAAQTIAPAS